MKQSLKKVFVQLVDALVLQIANVRCTHDERQEGIAFIRVALDICEDVIRQERLRS